VLEGAVLTTTEGLPRVKSIFIGDLPSLKDVVLTAQEIRLETPSAERIELTFPAMDDPINDARALQLENTTVVSVAASFGDQTPFYARFDNVPGDLAIPGVLPPVSRFSWKKTVPELATLQQFGAPSTSVSFSLTPDESYPIIADYLAWLREQGSTVDVGVSDENGIAVPLEEIEG
jgi:hypothetical protein